MDVTNSVNEHHYISLNNAIWIIKTMSEAQLEKINNDEKVKKQSFVIYSLPGIGKSESLTNLAATPDHIKTIDINAEFGGSLSMPIQSIHDVGGKTKAQVVHALHEDIDELNEHAKAHPKEPHYLFLDEFNRGDEFMKQTLMQLLLNTKVPGHDLEPNIFVVGAGNTAENVFTEDAVDNEVNPIDVAGRDRIAPFFVQLDVQGWIKWAYQNQINEKVIQFIESQDEPENVLYQAPQTTDGTGATPRSWSKLSDALELDAFSDYSNLQIMSPLVSAYVGSDLATQFINFLNTQGSFSINELLSDPQNALEKFEDLTRTDQRQALMMMPRYIERHLSSNNLKLKDPDDTYKSFISILDTKDQQILERFIKIFFESDMKGSNIMTQAYPLLHDRLRHSKKFTRLASQYAKSV